MLSDVIRLVQGRRTDNRGLFEASYFFDGKWTTWRSLQARDLGTAERRAALAYDRIRSGNENPHTAGKHTVEQVAKIVLNDLHKRLGAIQIEGKQHTIRQRIRVIERHIIPDVGDKDIRALNDADALERWRTKITVSRNGGQRPPARSTLANINGALQEINRAAQSRGWLRIDDMRRLQQNRAPKGERRPSFTAAEMHRIGSALSHRWVKAGHTARVREHRLMLRAMVAMIACTGIRPGLELETLTKAQVRLDHRDGIFVHVRSQQGKKTGSRSLLMDEHDPAWPNVRRIIGDYVHKQAGDPLFLRQSDGRRPNYAVTFREFLDEFDMRVDPITGRERTLYSWTLLETSRCG